MIFGGGGMTEARPGVACAEEEEWGNKGERNIAFNFQFQTCYDRPEPLRGLSIQLVGVLQPALHFIVNVRK